MRYKLFSMFFARALLPSLRGNSASGHARVRKVIAFTAEDPDQQIELQLQCDGMKVLGSGTFGVVYLEKLAHSDEPIAVKRVRQDKRYKNRELQILRMLKHKNIVQLKYFYYSPADKSSTDDLFLNLILEYVPDTVSALVGSYARTLRAVPILFVKLYTFQLYRALAYLHSIGVSHRDIKPQNLLIDPNSGTLKVCDFGSAKYLVEGEANVAYMCSRYYRPPELIFGATGYTSSVDIWSAGCVLAEMLLGHPPFRGESSGDQLVEIINVLGTPTTEDVHFMNPKCLEQNFPIIKARSWWRVLPLRAPADAAALLSKVLVYRPADRPSALTVCANSFFDALRQPNCRLPNGRPIPSCTDFTPQELGTETHLAGVLCYTNQQLTESASSMGLNGSERNSGDESARASTFG